MTYTRPTDPELEAEHRAAWDSKYVLIQLSARRWIVVERSRRGSASKSGDGPWESTPIGTVVTVPLDRHTAIATYRRLRQEEEADAS